MDLIFNPSQYLYHGTINLYADIIAEQGIRVIKRRNSGVDFGSGFYVTVGNRGQAVEWAEYKTKYPTYVKEALEPLGITFRDFLAMSKKLKPALMIFRIIQPEKWSEFNHKLFLYDNVDWKNYVWTCRQTNSDTPYDWVFGPVADGGLNDISPLHIRSYGKGYNQMAISSKTVSKIALVEVKLC